jgi:signal transduction histidine kinase
VAIIRRLNSASPPAMSSAAATRRQARLTALRRLQHALPGASDVRQLMRVLEKELSSVLDATGMILALYDELTQMVEVIHQVEGGVELPGGSFPLGNGFVSEVIRSGQPRLIRDWSVEGPRVQVQYATDTPGLPQSALTVPFLVGDRVIGVLSIQSYKPNAYDEDDLLVVHALASQVAPSIDTLQRGQAVQTARRANRLEAVLASMHEALVMIDEEGRILSLNAAARDMFGPLGGGVILGQPLGREQWGQWPLGARAVADALTPVVQALQRGEACRDLEVELHSQGRRLLSFSSAPVYEPSGRLAGGVIVFRDVTTQRHIARLKDELLSIASHDLKTPVTVLRGQAQLMRHALDRGAAEPDELLPRVERILDQTERLTRMLNLLLDLSRVEAGRLDLDRRPINLVNVIGRVVVGVRELSTRHQIQVQAPPVVEGEWDAGRLEQVIQNLLTNAVKYSPEGGLVSVGVQVDDTTVTVSVRDQGLGIPAEDLPHVFERFYRVEGTRRLEGSGLGLYICNEIVSAHGGRTWVESEGPGHGSTFFFSLPRSA